MNTPCQNRHRSAFTLIELLVVISIIAILASMAFPVVTGVMEKGRKVRTLAVIKDLQVAIKGYQTEYNRYPVGSSNEEQRDTGSGNTLIPILMAADSQAAHNGRDISFIDLPIAKNGRGGLIGTDEDSYYLVDEWAKPYYVLMDTDGNQRVKNPDTENEDSKVSSGASPELPLGVAIYSLGPDSAKKSSPSKDDITSWRS
jgi:prepilin-type N-terminal cleavage/methylation domain-containing protein